MKTSVRSFHRFLVALVVFSACANDADEIMPIPRGLMIDGNEQAVVGSLGSPDREFRFRSEVAEGGFAVQVDFNGMTIAIERAADGWVSYDGIGAQDGGAVQMTDEDRAALLELTVTLDALGEDVVEPIERLRGFTNLWSEFPTHQSLHGEVRTDFRAFTSLCGSVNTYREATHDDWDHDRGEDATTYSAYLSMHGAGPCSDGTYFWINGAWRCEEPDHDPAVEFAYGDCFGRCGAGCGGGTQFTVDCLDHDSCVRFGHSITSLWCDDEFVSTIDDWASAPNCL